VPASKSESSEQSEFYRRLDLSGQVLEVVRADYVEKPDDSKMIEGETKGHACGARCPFVSFRPIEF
jgi:hypothetical protein